MGLHAITEDTLHYHCSNPDCQYHNCANWEPWQTCAHHDTHEYVTIPAREMQERMQGLLPPEHMVNIGDTIVMQQSTKGRQNGETQQVPINHPGIEWTAPDIVALPTCECGTRMFLKVSFTDEELAAPNIQIPVRDPQDPTKITRIDQHPMVARHQQLAAKLTELGNVHVPQPLQGSESLVSEAAEAFQLKDLEDLVLNILEQQGLSMTNKMPAIKKP